MVAVKHKVTKRGAFSRARLKTVFKLGKPFLGSFIAYSVVDVRKANVSGSSGSALASTKCILQKMLEVQFFSPGTFIFEKSFRVEVIFATQYCSSSWQDK